LIIRVEADRKKGKDVCAITLANPEELHAFFKGLRRIVEALGHNIELMEGGSRTPSVKTRPTEARGDERDALVLKARQKNARAFTPWTREEEQEIQWRFESGESIPAIARSRKRSPRALNCAFSNWACFLRHRT